MSDPLTQPIARLRAPCASWCGHAETGADPYAVALAIAAHWRERHADLIEAPFLAACDRPGCGRLTWARYCCERCMASDDGGKPLAPWVIGADPVAVHDRACEDRARARAATWYAGSARAGGRR